MCKFGVRSGYIIFGVNPARYVSSASEICTASCVCARPLSGARGMLEVSALLRTGEDVILVSVVFGAGMLDPTPARGGFDSVEGSTVRADGKTGDISCFDCTPDRRARLFV